MSRLWVCLAREDARDAVRRTLLAHESEANVLFVDSAGELRLWARDAAPGSHVAVGPLGDGFSSLNVAAAVVHDGGASEVVVVAASPDEDFVRNAKLLGASTVLDLSLIAEDPADGIDEPDIVGDDVPTLVIGALSPERRESLLGLPAVDVQPVQKPRLRVTPRAGTGTHAPIIVLLSGRGGVGKTAITAAMASAAASWGMRGAVCDLDLSCGNLYSMFGMSGPADLASLVLENAPTAEELYACGRQAAERITVWGPCERPEMADAITPQTERLLDVLAEKSDLVLVDTCTTLTDAVAQAIQQCDRLVLVVDGRPGSAAAQARLGSLAVRLGVARTRIARLANRCGRRGHAEPAINRAEVGLETARPLRVLDGGAEVSDCLGEGKIQDLFDLGSKFAESSAQSLAKLLKELGCLPDVPQATRLVEQPRQRSIWSFGRVREAM